MKLIVRARVRAALATLALAGALGFAVPGLVSFDIAGETQSMCIGADDETGRYPARECDNQPIIAAMSRPVREQVDG